MNEDAVAIVDIGSNSIRLVVYRGLTRTPLPIFNEKTVCALGAGMQASGRLNPIGIKEAHAALSRYVALARAMSVKVLDVVATAAVRDAVDGAKFIAEIEKRQRLKVTVLSGEEEAHHAAMGVLCGVPEADGTVADLGGGSLELVALDQGHLAGPFATMKLGVLRLAEASAGDRAHAAQLIDQQFDEVDWFGWGQKRPLYAVGGAWRALARLFISQTGHPLQVLDNFTLERGDALRLLDLVSRQSRKSLDKVPGLSRKRLPHLPMAALLLERVLQRMQPSHLIFSVYGMREGRFFAHLPPDVRLQDPLIAACEGMAKRYGRFPEHGAELFEWMAPVMAGETQKQARLRYAACLLSDVFWAEHPDYRAEQSFLRVFRLPFMGIGHQDRAALALAVYYRYAGEFPVPPVEPALDLLGEEGANRALVTGLAMRLAHVISGGVPGVICKTKLIVEDGKLVLAVPGNDPIIPAELSERPYERLARALGLDGFALRILQ